MFVVIVCTVNNAQYSHNNDDNNGKTDDEKTN